MSLDLADIPDGITETELALKLYSKLSESINEQNIASEPKFSSTEESSVQKTENLNIFRKVGNFLSKISRNIQKTFHRSGGKRI